MLERHLSRRPSRLATSVVFAAGFALTFFGVLGAPGAAQTAPPNIGETLTTYLQEDCGVGEPRPTGSLTAVLELGDRAVPLLASAVRKGPPDEVVCAVRDDAASDYERLARYLAGDGLDGLDDPELRERARSLDRESYVGQRLRSVVRGYRERGANALAALDSDAARRALRRLAEESDEETRDLVRRAIEDRRGSNRPIG